MQQAVKRCRLPVANPHMKSWDNFEELGADIIVNSTELRKQPGMKTSSPLNQFPDMSTLRLQTLSEDTPTAVAKLMAYEISPPMTNWKFRDQRGQFSRISARRFFGMNIL